MFHRKEISIMFQQIFLAVIGFCAGVIIAGGVVGLLIGLSIVPRYAGVTHTGKQILRCSELFSAIFSFYIAGPFQGAWCFLAFADFSPAFSWGDGSWHWPKWQMSSPSFPEGSS